MRFSIRVGILLSAMGGTETTSGDYFCTTGGGSNKKGANTSYLGEQDGYVRFFSVVNGKKGCLNLHESFVFFFTPDAYDLGYKTTQFQHLCKKKKIEGID